jgi:hypothetical protein
MIGRTPFLRDATWRPDEGWGCGRWLATDEQEPKLAAHLDRKFHKTQKYCPPLLVNHMGKKIKHRVLNGCSAEIQKITRYIDTPMCPASLGLGDSAGARFTIRRSHYPRQPQRNDLRLFGRLKERASALFMISGWERLQWFCHPHEGVDACSR